MTSYLSISEIYEENKVLKEKIIELEKKIQKLKTKNRQLNEKIDAQNEEISNEILEYFH
jgi:predicted  nucleic acid-binding Zn-ribbon protein